MLPIRINLIWHTLRDNEDVEYVVAYGISNEASLSLRVLSGADYDCDEKVAVGQSPTRIYELELSDERTVNLVHTPFFGVGQLSYEQVGQIAEAAGNR